MSIIHGFVLIPQFTNNQLGVIAPVGELDKWAATYATDVQSHQWQSLTLLAFRSVMAGIRQMIPATDADVVLRAITTFIQRGATHTPALSIPEVIVASAGAIEDITLGASVVYQGVTLPTKISFYLNNNNQFHLWLHGDTFKAEYPFYELKVVPPTTTIDDLLLPILDLKRLVESSTFLDFQIGRVFEAQGNSPATHVHTLTLQRREGNVVVNIQINTLIYGEAGFHDDLIKAAIEAYIMAHTALPEAAWRSVYPVIWYRPEALVVLDRQTVAVANLTEKATLFSTIVSNQRLTQLRQSDPLAGTERFLSKPLEYLVFASSFRGLGVIVSNTTNTPLTFSSLFPDYLPISSGHVDFVRMSSVTRGWIVFMESLLLCAIENRIINAQFRFVERDGIQYVQGSYASVQWLVAVWQTI